MQCRKTAIAACAAFVLSAASFAQTQKWVTTYEGPAPGQDADEGRAVEYVDGSVYTAGYGGNASGVRSMTALSFTQEGTTRWTFVLAGSNFSEAYDVAVGGGNAYLAGFTTGSATGKDFSVATVDAATGTLVSLFSYNSGSADEAVAVAFGEDGDVYACGQTTQGSMNQWTVMRLHVDVPTGQTTQVWSAPYIMSGIFGSYAYDIVYGGDNKIYTCGQNPNSEFTVVCLNKDTGSEIWRYENPTFFGAAYSVIFGGDGKVYACGHTQIGVFTVVKLDPPSGNQIWLFAEQYGLARTLVYGNDTNIYVAGYDTQTSSGSTDLAVMKIDRLSGTKVWDRYVDGSSQITDEAFSIAYGRDGGVYAAGYFQNPAILGGNPQRDFVVVAYWNDGTPKWSSPYKYGDLNNSDTANGIVRGQFGNVYAVGVSFQPGNASDFTVVNLGTE